MSKKRKIIVKDFDLFDEAIQALSKVVPSAKIILTSDKMEIYVQNSISRCQFVSDAVAVEGDEPLEICVRDVPAFLKIFRLIRKEHPTAADIHSIKWTYSEPFIHITSKLMKAKIGTIKEDVISNFISNPVKTELKSLAEFHTNSDAVRNICLNKFIFNDLEQARIYLKIDEEMNRNDVYAELNNRMNPLSNSVTLKFARLVEGELTKDITIDFDRLLLFNLLKSDEIVINYMDKNVLYSKTSLFGGTKDSPRFLTLTLYNSIRKS